MVVTRDNLHQLASQKLGDRLLIVVSNREPYVHTFSGGAIECLVPASGLTVALDPVMRACGGTWVAHGSGDADREVVDSNSKVLVPPKEPAYSLRRVWLSKEQEDGYYYGFSNQALWPLCHIAYVRPLFDEAQWETYKAVNELFADTVCSEMGDRKAFVFIQDYHLALLSRMIKERKPDVITAQFWHIPWPNREAFRVCPWQEELLDGLLGNDLLGFQIRYHCNNFLDTIDRTIEAKVDYERYEVTRGGKKTAVHPFPISIDFEEINSTAHGEDVLEAMHSFRQLLGLDNQFIGLGLDRIDYTKGILERFRAFDRFLVKYPQYEGKAVLIQAGVPSRVHINAYKLLNEEVDSLAEEINWRHASGRWKPIIYLRRHLSPTALLALRRLAHFMVVSSLHDGMNLVAKEYVASRSDEDGVLILSPFTGAARELTDAMLVNPYAPDEFAEAIKTALEMPREERRTRMRRMRGIIEENNIYKWAADILAHMTGLDQRE